jgi:hypothetical protein
LDNQDGINGAEYGLPLFITRLAKLQEMVTWPARILAQTVEKRERLFPLQANLQLRLIADKVQIAFVLDAVHFRWIVFLGNRL